MLLIPFNFNVDQKLSLKKFSKYWVISTIEFFQEFFCFNIPVKLLQFLRGTKNHQMKICLAFKLLYFIPTIENI